MIDTRCIVSKEVIIGAIAHRLLRFGLNEAHIEDVCSTLVETSLRGVDTHGVELLPFYIRELEGGRANSSPSFCESGSETLISIDADNALGVVAGNVAMRRAIEIAEKRGLAGVSVRNSNHFGAAGHYAALAANQGMIGIAMSNSDALVAPHNGSRALTGTNPIAIVAPGHGELFHLDMATSQIAYSRAIRMLAAGQPLPANLAIDDRGIDTAISGKLGALLPLGGYKGQGLGMAVQILSGVLGDGPLDHEMSNLYTSPFNDPHRIGHFFMAVKISDLIPLDLFTRRVSHLLSCYRNDGVEGKNVQVPGDIEGASYASRLRDGIPISSDLYYMLERWI